MRNLNVITVELQLLVVHSLLCFALHFLLLLTRSDQKGEEARATSVFPCGGLELKAERVNDVRDRESRF